MVTAIASLCLLLGTPLIWTDEEVALKKALVANILVPCMVGYMALSCTLNAL
jgi:hypothetical protein